MEFKDRLKEARLKKGYSQSKLCKLIGIHVTNISRYERGENKPTTEALTKIANALDVTTDFLMDGTIGDKAKDAISDKELLSMFQKMSQLTNDKKAIIKEVIDAYLMKVDLQNKFATH